jgi:Protein of unknown function (DUF3631)
VTANVNENDLLSRLVAFIRRFVVLNPTQAVVVALWIVHGWVFDAADATPYLQVTSPEKQSGKTLLLEVLSILAKKPWLTGRVSVAVLARKIQAECPTLLLDESDAAFRGPQEYSEGLRAVLNTGYRRGGCTSLCVGKGAEISYKDFSTFCPKAIAGIGTLPDTIADRSIPIRLKRRTRSEQIERFRFRNAEKEACTLKRELKSWAARWHARLRDARPSLPEELSDRQQDVAEPLLAIADSFGGDWPERARRALLQLCTGRAAQDQSLGAQLLADIRAVFTERVLDKISSAGLVQALTGREGRPWAELPLTRNKLAWRLAPYEIHPANVRDGEKQYKGYERKWFEDAFARYLPPLDRPPEPSQPSQGNVYAASEQVSELSQGAPGTDARHEESLDFMRVGTDGTDRTPVTGEEKPPPSAEFANGPRERSRGA